MFGGDGERQPLLTSPQSDVGNREPVQYSLTELPENLDLPPAYTPSPSTPTGTGSNVTISSDIPVINCRVCHALLHVEGRYNSHVITCNSCGEATPIRPAPPMKKYVRCPCNCLLICKVTSQRIICPRVNCKRVISLLPSTDSINRFYNEREEQNAATVRINCAYCGDIAVTMLTSGPYHYCHSCGKKSFISSAHKRNVLSVCGAVLGFCIVVLVVTIVILFHYVSEALPKYLVTAIFGVLITFCLLVFYGLTRRKKSRIEHPPALQYT